MNALLQTHGCSNVFTIPEGLKEIMADITREVLRDQPTNILEYIANYLSALLITREHGFLAVKILEDLCDCRPTLEELLGSVGIDEEKVGECAKIVQESFEDFDPTEGEKLKEKAILKKLLSVVELDTDTAKRVCLIIQDVYRDYYERKQSLQETIQASADQPWKLAAQRTIDIYKTTRPTFEELVRATEKIQAAYRGYHVRRLRMEHLHAKPPPPQESATTALDVAGSREIDLGPKMDVRKDSTAGTFYVPTEDIPPKPEDTQEDINNAERMVSVASGVDKELPKTASVPFSRRESAMAEQEKEPGAVKSESALKLVSPPSTKKTAFHEDLVHEESRTTTYQDDFEEEYGGSRSEADGASETASSVASEALTSAAADTADEMVEEALEPASESVGQDTYTTDEEEAD